MRLYQDGNEVGSVPKTGTVFQSPAKAAYIGANPRAGDLVFDGRIDDVKLFGRALTPAEIAHEMATPAVPVASCSAGPIRGHESDALLWFVVALVGVQVRRRWRRSV